MKKITRNRSRNKSYIGMCGNSLHKGHLTLEVAHNHHCLEKECLYFHPNLEHAIYMQKDYTSKKIPFKALVRMRTLARAIFEIRLPQSHWL